MRAALTNRSLFRSKRTPRLRVAFTPLRIVTLRDFSLVFRRRVTLRMRVALIHPAMAGMNGQRAFGVLLCYGSPSDE